MPPETGYDVTDTDTHLTESLAIASLVMRLGEVERATRHPDGRHETDTTHTVMLALTAWRLAKLHNGRQPEHDPWPYGPLNECLDPELVLIYALAHDLPEAIAGDVVTLRPLDADAKRAKADAEAAAVESIRDELPWLAEVIDYYEAQDDDEARFVHFLDKLMPKLTHIHDGCRVLRERGMDREELVVNQRAQGARLAAGMPDRLAWVRDLFDAATDACVVAYRDEADDLEPPPAHAEPCERNVIATGAVLASALPRYLVYDPEDGADICDTREEAERTFDVYLDGHTEDAVEGIHESVDQLAMYELVPIKRAVVRVLATADDETEDGERCRDGGWDYTGAIEEEDFPPPADPALLALANRHLLDGVRRIAALVGLPSMSSVEDIEAVLADRFSDNP